jgi:arsenate reductase (thioredoxin)
MKTILFLCGHNAGRSQMAEAYFNSLGNEEFKAVSAGTKPSKEINAMAKKVMEKEGIDTSVLYPKKLDKRMSDGVDVVFTMGCNVDCGIFEFPVKVDQDLGLDDPHGQGEEAVKEIFEKIKKIINHLNLKQYV